MHVIAMKVAGHMGIPWLADFRDPWTGIDFYKDLHLTRMADRKHHRLEKEVLQKASAVTVISPGMAEDLYAIHPRKYEFISNGFDPDDLHTGEQPVLDEKFSVSYIGTLTGSRNLLVLWAALKELVSENEGFRKDLVIRLVGKADYTVKEAIRSHGLEGFVTRIEYLPHDEAIRIQQASQVLLLLINDTPNAKSILTGKFFEYMASRRPVLCIGPEDGDAANILRQTSSGLVSGYHDLRKAKENILSFYREFKAGSLQSESRNTGQFSRKALTQKLALLLDRIS
jgi:glycosyltransferase involved in cell wall biosynthesis